MCFLLPFLICCLFSLYASEQAVILETANFSQTGVVKRVDKLRILEDGTASVLQQDGIWQDIKRENNRILSFGCKDQLKQYLLGCHFDIKQFTNCEDYTLIALVRGLGGGNTPSKGKKKITPITDPEGTLRGNSSYLQHINEFVNACGHDAALFYYSLLVCVVQEKERPLNLEPVKLLIEHGADVNSTDFMPTKKAYLEKVQKFYNEKPGRNNTLFCAILMWPKCCNWIYGVLKKHVTDLERTMYQAPGTNQPMLFMEALADRVYQEPLAGIFSDIVISTISPISQNEITIVLERIRKERESGNIDRERLCLKTLREILAKIIMGGMKLNEKNQSLLTELQLQALLLGIKERNTSLFSDKITKMISDGVDINSRDSSNNTVLYRCLQERPINFVATLIFQALLELAI